MLILKFRRRSIAVRDAPKLTQPYAMSDMSGRPRPPRWQRCDSSGASGRKHLSGASFGRFRPTTEALCDASSDRKKVNGHALMVFRP